MPIQREYPPPADIADYAELIMDLNQYAKELGLTDKPDMNVRVFFHTGTAGKPIGSVIPVYSSKRCGPDELGLKHALYNLHALADFTPPEHF